MNRDTNGAFYRFRIRTLPLESPPLHRHRKQDEWWYIVKGEYRFEVDGHLELLGPPIAARPIVAGCGAG